MLPYISTQKDYAKFHREANSLLSETEQDRLRKKKFSKALRKMLLLEPERVELLVLACYTKTGRPALDPVITLRSFILMLHFGYTSVDNWVNEVKDDKALQYLIGDWNVPPVASHYDFINRLLRIKPKLNELYMKGKNSTANKNKYRKHHKGEKWENYDEGDTYRNGYDKSKSAIKFCCPRQTECPHAKDGKTCRKVLKVYDKTSYKFFVAVQYRSDEWKELYNN